MKRLGIFYGGDGEERDVSIKSKQSVVRALKESDYSLIEIEVAGGFLVNGEAVDTSDFGDMIDVALIAMHGSFGEDGQLQKILRSEGIPYVGTGPLASFNAFSKATTKEILSTFNIQTAAYLVFDRKDIENKGVQAIAQEIFSSLPQPCVIKPSTSGSSYGVSIAKTLQGIGTALGEALQYSDQIVVEEFIKGTEYAVGIIEDYRDESLYVLPPVEIVPPSNKDFFDTESKYDGSSQEICPAVIPDDLSDSITSVTRDVFKKLFLRDYARVDFIAHPTRGLFVLEVNTLPGLTSESLFPKELKAVGISEKEFFELMVERANARLSD